MTETITWPVKTREMHSHHFDSTIWNDLKFRDDDIVVATYAKAGTTWMQQIIGQMLFGGDPELRVADMSPWVDLRVPPKEVKLPEIEAQTHRRFLKTHLPVDALVFSPKAKYLYIGRDGRDVVWSMYNHHANANQAWYEALNDTPGRVGPPIGPPAEPISAYWREWMDRDGHPFWPFWENIRSWWAIRELPNVLMVHFIDLKRDMPGRCGGSRIPRHSHRRVALGRDRRVLHVRLDEEERELHRPAGGHLLGRGRADVHQQGGQRPLARYADGRRHRGIRSPGRRRTGRGLRAVAG
jgi:aryl sulfotransferase